MRWLPFFMMIGCSSAGVDLGARDTSDTGSDGTIGNGCTYPAGAVEPMAVGSVLSPYSWPEAIDRRTDARGVLDLAGVPCDSDELIDWSPFDVLLFISIPAW